MIVADNKKAIFIHIQKTGGSSITNLLMPHISEHHKSATPKTASSKGHGWQKTWHIDRIQHSKFANALPVLDKYNIDPNEYYKFAFVRNPYSWLLSVWGNKYQSPTSNQRTWLKQLRGKISDITGINKLPAQQFYSKYPDGSFRNFVKFIDSNITDKSQKKQSKYLGFADQYSYIENDRGIEFDYIGKLENFNADLHAIDDKINLTENLKVPRINYKSAIKNRDKYLDYYDDESIRIVNRVFARDFDNFGYHPISHLP